MKRTRMNKSDLKEAYKLAKRIASIPFTTATADVVSVEKNKNMLRV